MRLALPSGHWPLAEAEIDRLIDEDFRFGDLTTRALGIGKRPGRITYAARQGLVLCGSEEASRLFSRLGASVRFTAPTGLRADKDTLLLEAEGPAAILQAGWKVAQTLMEWASGIATAASEIVASARREAPRIAVLCTRKSVPFTRQISLKAVLAGGGEIHRLGLSDSIMLFDEHRVFWPHPGDFKTIVAQLRSHAPERAVMVEVTTEADAFAAAEAMADVIQLEKFSPGSVARVVHAIRKRPDGRPVIAAAGGITTLNAGEYAKAGADTLVTSAPYYARPVDIQVRLLPL
ncbi:MAG TPA: ModD protein [Methylocella sp.]|nr:ModD protein [Methylocella sp.]